VEVVTEKDDILNDEKNWLDLVKTKSWATAVLKANVASSFDVQGLASIVRSIYNEHPIEIKLDDVEDKDWVSYVQQMWQPQVIGDITVRFPWHENIPTNTRHSLVLEGGAAFGTGDHPTTRLCCRWLEKNIKSTEKSTVLDYGCGSAILALGK
jgi:ribosomal protein L11 methyltransferase